MNTQFASFFSTPESSVFLFSKGRVGLYTLLKSMNLGSGDEAIVSGYTCVMVPSAPKFLGITSKYVDIDPQTYNLNPDLLDSLVTPKTRVLIIQHTYGIAQNMEPVLAWAAKRGIPIIEDCCHAFGSTYKGKLCGTFGAGAFFSGQWNKPFSTGLGGMLLVNDHNLREKVAGFYTNALTPGAFAVLRISAQIFAYNNLVTPRTTAVITQIYRMASRLGLAAGSSSNAEFKGEMPSGYFSKMAGPQIREGLKNLKTIDALIAHRRKITAFYERELPGLGYPIIKADPDCDNVIIRYPVRVGNKAELLSKALKQGVELGSWFEIPLHPAGIDMEKFGYKVGMCPQAEKACQEVVNLPTHGKVSLQEAGRVVEFIRQYARVV